MGCPTAAVIRRTWRLRPSRNVTPIQLSATLFRTRIGGSRGHRSGGSLGPGGPRHSVLEPHPAPQRRETGFPGFTLDLHQIGLGQLEARIRDPGLQSPVVAQQQQALAVAVEPACGIDARPVDEVGQSLPGGL